MTSIPSPIFMKFYPVSVTTTQVCRPDGLVQGPGAPRGRSESGAGGGVGDVGGGHSDKGRRRIRSAPCLTGERIFIMRSRRATAASGASAYAGEVPVSKMPAGFPVIVRVRLPFRCYFVAGLLCRKPHSLDRADLVGQWSARSTTGDTNVRRNAPPCPG